MMSLEGTAHSSTIAPRAFPSIRCQACIHDTWPCLSHVCRSEAFIAKSIGTVGLKKHIRIFRKRSENSTVVCVFQVELRRPLSARCLNIEDRQTWEVWRRDQEHVSTMRYECKNRGEKTMEPWTCVYRPARVRAQTGPASTLVRSSTLIPSNGREQLPCTKRLGASPILRRLTGGTPASAIP
jgi:hypothetical protein